MKPAAATSSTGAGFGQESRGYQLHSELAKYCLPSASRDAARKFAWVNSICFLFLVVGLVGLKPPQIFRKPVAENVDIVPVVFTPPPVEEKFEPDPQPQDQSQKDDAAPDTPQVATVVAADTAAVAFSVPVQGPVVFAPARFASAPPATPPKAVTAPPKPTVFRPTVGDGGHYPAPTYPRQAREHGDQGTVMLSVTVDPAGSPASVEVKDSSGHSSLDRHALQWVKNYWQWPAGQTRLYLLPIAFQLSN